MIFHTEVQLETADPVLEAKRVRQALEGSKVVHIRSDLPLGDLRAFYDSLVEHIGTPDEIGEDFTQGGAKTGERWLEIRYDADIPDMAAFRHSKNAQPLHTDESYISDFADVMLFYCVNQAPSGGSTIFVDGPAIEDRLRAVTPGLHEALLNTSVRYAKADDARLEPIIGHASNGATTFNFNYYCIDPEAPAEQKALNQAFHDFLQAEVDRDQLIHRVSLAPGDSVAWWDKSVLHGRDAFEATRTNERFIWKAGIRW